MNLQLVFFCFCECVCVTRKIYTSIQMGNGGKIIDDENDDVLSPL